MLDIDIVHVRTRKHAPVRAEQDPATDEPIRVTVFVDAPGMILLNAPRGGVAALPPMPSPFDVIAVRKAYAAAGIDARVSEGVARGEMAETIRQRRLDVKSERRQRANLESAAAALRLKASESPVDKTRGQLMDEKVAVDSRLRVLRDAIGRAKSAVVTSGVYMDADKFRALEREFEDAKQRSQGIQAALGRLKCRPRESSDAQQRLDFLERFMAAARDLLDEQDFADICDATKDDDDA